MDEGSDLFRPLEACCINANVVAEEVLCGGFSCRYYSLSVEKVCPYF